MLADRSVAYRIAAIKFPEPVLSYAIEPKSRADEEKISTALHRLQEEDPSISYNRDAQTKELLLAGQGRPGTSETVRARETQPERQNEIRQLPESSMMISSSESQTIGD